MHIFVIDDETAICAIIGRVLKAKNHSVETLSSLHAAILALEVSRPDGLITDFNLDTGTCRPIIDLAIEKRISTIVVMSGNPDNKRGLPEGVSFLTKPIDLETIKAIFPAG